MKRFERIRLLLGIVVLMGVLAAVVVLGSPYAPAAQPPMEIEALWAIEDTRQESDVPLITALENHGVPLAYSEADNTFYCTLGLQNGESWPQLYLTAPDAEGVSFCFSDDYTYDWCSDAICDGYSYEMMAYTEEAYSYFNIVFTGLPIVQLTTQEAIGPQDIPAGVSLSAFGEDAVVSHARVHRRGGISRSADKKSYKIEYTRNGDGTKKIALNTPGIGQTGDLVLLAMHYDRSLIRDRLSWEIYGQMTQGKANFIAPRMQYVELFINHEYAGVYLMFEPFDLADELEAAGAGSVLTDSIYRTCVTYLTTERPYVEHPYRGGAGYELFYAPEGMALEEPLRNYIDILTEEDDARFCEKALEQIDIRSMLESLIMVQAGGMADNVFNNLYIWADKTAGGYIYRYIPWDMDQSWGMKKEDVGEMFENWMYFPIADRLLELDAGGRLRSDLHAMWTGLRQGALSEANIEALVTQYAHELNDSGALRRNADRWQTEHYYEDGFEIFDFMQIRFALLDETIERLVSGDGSRPLFLERTQYEGKGSAIEWSEN